MSQLLITDEFASALAQYEAGFREVILSKVRLLQENAAHPGLNVHRIKHTDNKWECYINKGHRIIYDVADGTLRLWKLGGHVIIDRVRHASFAAHTAFRRPDWLEDEEEGARIASVQPAWTEVEAQEPAGSENPFREFPPAYLRLLGVPADLVKAVRSAPSAEALLAMEGLPERTVAWLMELLTNAELEQVIYDPSRLLFSTTLDRLEGYCQGSIRQLMLNLTPDQQQYVQSPMTGVTVLKGVAGSGKTTVGIYRAVALAEQGRRVLLLTYSKTLNAVTRNLLESLVGAPLPDNLEVVNIDRWIGDFLAWRGVSFTVLDDAACMPLLTTALDEAREQGSEAVLQLRPDFFRDEIARVIKGGGLRTLEQYLNVERHGRKTALAPEQRRAVWRVYEGYERRLGEAGARDWRDPALLAYDLLTREPLETPYDDVIIDEGQDLSAIQLRVAQRLIRGGDLAVQRTLLLLGDAAQTIYSRGFSWRQAGINARGRTSVLRRNHRNTRQIAEAAAELLAHNRLLKADADFVQPEWTQRAGPWPLVVEAEVADLELRAVRERLLDLAGDQQFRVSDFAVLCPTNELCEAVRDNLLAAGLPCVLHRDEEFHLLEEQVKVLTIHAAKGLEFPVVFVVGVRENLLPRRPPLRLDSEERDLELERQRTLLYVAMTRAAEALFLVTTGASRSAFLGELGPRVRAEPFVRR